MAILLIVVVLIFTFSWIFVRSRRQYHYPPGPRGIPVFGSAFQIDMDKFVSHVTDLGTKYKDAFTLRLFTQRLVVLNSYDMIKEVMEAPKSAEIVSGRPLSFMAQHYFAGDIAFMSYSKEWSALRKMAFRGLKTYGTHLKVVEGLVQKELTNMVDWIQINAGVPVDPYDYITGYVTCIIVMLMTGRKLAYDDPLMKLCSEIPNLGDTLSHPVTSAKMTYFPWLRWIPFGCGKMFQELQYKTDILITSLFEDRQGINDDQKECFLTFLIAEQKKGTIDASTSKQVLLDLIIAGVSTTRSAMYSLFLVLAQRPDVQKRMQDEIDAEVGSDRVVTVDDKQRMPYVQAVVQEGLRLYPSAPLTVPHLTMEDLPFREYVIPKDTVVTYNIWNVQHDPQFWKGPWKFNPHRFLDDNGKYVSPDDERRQRMIAFGVGRRFCLGEGLSRLRIFMAVVTLLQKFRLRPSKDFPLPDPDPRTFDMKLLLSAPRYRLIFEPRNAT